MVRFNRVIIGGNLVRDPEIRFLPSGLSVTNFTVAVNHTFRQDNEKKEEVSYFDVVVFGKQGETCAEYLSKGRSVLVEGRLRQRRWESDDGQRRSKIEIVAQQVQFLGPPREGDKGGQRVAEPEIDPVDEDIPF